MNEASTEAGNMRETPVCFVYSFNHHRAVLDVRERLKLDNASKQKLEENLCHIDGLMEYLILDTCNRWELYGVASSQRVGSFIWDLITKIFPFPADELKSIVSEYRGNEMIRHLFEVSAGVDSQMIGETEIFGQVKTAFGNATKTRTAGSILNRIFSKAFQAAKWVRTHTSIGRGQVSIGNVSVDLACRIFGDLDECRVLLIGTGEVGRLTAQALKTRAVGSISFTSRTRKNAEKLAGEIGGEVIEFDAFQDHLHGFDIVITSTAATQFIIDKATIKSALARRSYRPVFLIDLAIPRDVEPSVSKVPQVFLYNLDDVSMIANNNFESRGMEISECKKILAAKAWVTWLDVMRRHRRKSFRKTEPETGEK